MTHIYIPKSSDMWCIHHYGSTEVNMHLDFLGTVQNCTKQFQRGGGGTGRMCPPPPNPPLAPSIHVPIIMMITVLKI